MSATRIVLCASAAVAVLLGACSNGGSPEGGRDLRLATTTSVQDSGLLELLLPHFEKETGYRVGVSAIGSGKALERLASGDADVAITHAPGAERSAVAAELVARRTAFMFNDFVLVGPPEYAPKVAGAADARDAFRRVASSGHSFVSRGDGSGTHLLEKALWAASEIAPESPFVVSAGAGMGDTLERASDEEAFALADRSTFLVLRGDLDLAILFQGDAALRNVYSVIEPASGENEANRAGARALTDFLRSPRGRALIGSHGIESVGEPLFTPMSAVEVGSR